MKLFAQSLASASPGQLAQTSATKRRRLWQFAVLLLLSLTFTTSMTTVTRVQAQDEAAQTKSEPAAEEKPAATESTEAPAPAQKDMLTWMIEASGIFGGLIFLLSFVLVSLVILNIMQITRAAFAPPAFVEEFEQKINGRDYQGAFEMAKNDDSLLGRIMTAGLGNLNRGQAEAMKAMEDIGTEENLALEHKIGWISVISTVAPMLGLLGTVQGMILSFQQIASATVAPKPKDLAEGISTALFTTLEGLVVAIPAMVAFVFFRNRIARYMLEVGVISERLMNRIATASKAKPTAPAAAPGAPAAGA
jgi:biopolymer transport protein ExbB